MKPSDVIFPFEDRIKRLPKDQGGSVLLLTGMMAFMAAILALMALDTSQAIYNRVISQNAVDGAAETGALWQARGLNMLQTLNNAHYVFNAGIYFAEWACLVACDKTPLDAVADYGACPATCFPPGPECCEATTADTEADCTLCQQAGPLNDEHDNIASAILDWQATITAIIPILAWTYASDVAQASGADELTSVTSTFPLGSVIGLATITANIPGAQYATTVLPTSTLLNNSQVQGDNWPWKWNLFGVPESAWKTAAQVSWNVGRVACYADIWPRIFQGYNADFQDPSEWGWDDSYYQGVPGNMFWAAGKTNQTELAGLGFLRWMNGDSESTQVQNYITDETGNLVQYVGPATTSTALTIPSFIGVACSQAEGSKTEVVGKDASDFFDQIDVFDMPPVDSAAKLTTVFMPGTSTPGSDIFILH